MRAVIKSIWIIVLCLGLFLPSHAESFAHPASGAYLAPPSSWNAHSKELTGLAKLLQKLGITDDIRGNTIFGVPIAQWVRDHQLYYEIPETYHPYEENDARIMEDSIYRGSGSTVAKLKEILLGFYRKIGREEDGVRRLKNLWKKSQLWHYVKWMARDQCITQVRQKREGKLFGSIDVNAMTLEDLPIWPEDLDGRIAEDLINWMSVKGKAPPADYYLTRKVSIAQIAARALKKMPVHFPGQASPQRTIEPISPAAASL